MSQHTIVHVELYTPDPAVAGKFYEDLFGWKHSSSSMPEMDMTYDMGQPASGPALGYPKPQEGWNAGEVVIYVSSDDVDATLEKAKSLGATILGEAMDIPTVGRMGFLQDPTGTKIAVIKFLPPPTG